MTNDEMRAASGNVVSGDWLVNAVYLILRDHMPAGVVEELVMQIECGSSADGVATFAASLPPEANYTFRREQAEASKYPEGYSFTNGWLALYAANAAERLRATVELDDAALETVAAGKARATFRTKFLTKIVIPAK